MHHTSSLFYLKNNDLGVHNSIFNHMGEYAEMLREAGRKYNQALLGERFASQLMSDSTVLVAGIDTMEENKASYRADWLKSEAIQRIQATKPQILLPILN